MLSNFRAKFNAKLKGNVTRRSEHRLPVEYFHHGFRETIQHERSIRDLDSLGRLFDGADEDGSGQITKDEFHNLSAELLDNGTNEAEHGESLDNLFDEIDADGSGEIDFNELRTWYNKAASSKSGKRSRRKLEKESTRFPIKEGSVRVHEGSFFTGSTEYWMCLNGEDEVLRFYSMIDPGDGSDTEQREPISLHHEHSVMVVTERTNEIRLVYPKTGAEFYLLFDDFKDKQDWWVVCHQVQDWTKRLKTKSKIKLEPSSFSWICNFWTDPDLRVERKVSQKFIEPSMLPGFDVVEDADGVQSVEPHFWRVARVTYDRVVKIIIRPPRSEYRLEDLGKRTFTFMEVQYVRNDFMIQNPRGMNLQCSQWMSHNWKRGADERTVLIYLHGNASCRKEVLQQLSLLFSLGIDVVTLDTSGSGHSDGEYVSLGYYEQTDVHVLVKYLQESGKAGKIVIWGRSMGAATCLLYSGLIAAPDHKIAAIIADSSFSSMPTLARDYVNTAIKNKDEEVMKSFIREQAISMVDSDIQFRANFQMENCAPLEAAPLITAPTMLIHTVQDTTISISHMEEIYNQLKKAKSKVCVVEDQRMRKDGAINHNSVRLVQTFAKIANFLMLHLDLKGSARSVPPRYKRALNKVMLVQRLDKHTFFRSYEETVIWSSAPLGAKDKWLAHKTRFFNNVWTLPPWFLDWFFDVCELPKSKSLQKKAAIAIGKELMRDELGINDCVSGMTEERNNENQNQVAAMMGR